MCPSRRALSLLCASPSELCGFRLLLEDSPARRVVAAAAKA
jgi:hypothetical protein